MGPGHVAAERAPVGEGGERFEIAGSDTAFFPAGWRGTCEVLDTVRKVYMIR